MRKPPPGGGARGGDRGEVDKAHGSTAPTPPPELPLFSACVSVSLASTGTLTAKALTCCKRYPPMRHGICGACWGRVLLGYASRQEQAAAIKAAYEASMQQLAREHISAELCTRLVAVGMPALATELMRQRGDIPSTASEQPRSNP